MHRREFIKKSVAMAATAAAATTLGSVKKLMAAPAAGTPALVAVKGAAPGKMYKSAINALGGIKTFVKPNQIVVVKPNIGWNVEPEYAANTNPELVKEIVKSCLDAGAKKVYVFDHTCDQWQKSYKTSGIENAVKEAGGVISPGNEPRLYQAVKVPGGKALKDAAVHELILSSDVFINVPVLKSHGSTKLTIGMKNLMGIVRDRGWWHANNLHQCIADFAAFRRPDLTIVDAYRVMTDNGPRGVGSGEDIAPMQSLIATRDIVAADAAAAKIFGIEPEEIKYIKYAAEKNLGAMDLNTINIKKISL